jgi:hypothetical protein
MKYFLLAVLLLLPASAYGAVISYDDGTVFEVPEGYEVYVSDGLVFGLTRSDRQYRFQALLPADEGDLGDFDGLEVERSEPLDGVFVQGYGRVDDEGRGQLARLNIVMEFNDSILPEGREVGFSTNYLDHLQFKGLAAPDSDLSPDFTADERGETIGGIDNSDPWGNDIDWLEADTAIGYLGDVVSTPAGDYQVVQAGDGQLALRPLDDARSPGGYYFFNIVIRQHHIGIHPVSGVVWYQNAPCLEGIEGDDYWSLIGSGTCF